MPDHDLVVADQLFPATRADLNAAFLALASDFQGSAAPSNPQRGMDWYDTSLAPAAWKKYDGADWITLGVLDEVNNRFIAANSFAGGVYVVSAGTANAITLAIDFPYTVYRSGMTAVFKASLANTGPATVNINGLGAKPIMRLGGTAPLQAGDIALGAICVLIFDLPQDSWQLLNASFSQGVASEGSSGSVELATFAETYGGADDQRAVPPLKLAAVASGPFAIVASATTPNIETPNRYNVEITGSVTITGFVAASAVGITRRLFFAGDLTIAAGGNIELVTAASLSILTGSTATFVSTAGGNWKMVDYCPADGKPLSMAFATVAYDRALDKVLISDTSDGGKPKYVAGTEVTPAPTGGVTSLGNIGGGTTLLVMAGTDGTIKSLVRLHAVYLDGLLYNTTGAVPPGAFLSSAYITLGSNATQIVLTCVQEFNNVAGGGGGGGPD